MLKDYSFFIYNSTINTKYIIGLYNIRHKIKHTHDLHEWLLRQYSTDIKRFNYFNICELCINNILPSNEKNIREVMLGAIIRNYALCSLCSAKYCCIIKSM